MEKEDRQTSRKYKKTALIILCVILGLLLAILAAATIYVTSVLNRIQRPDEHETLSSEQADQLLKPDEQDLADSTTPSIHETDATMPTEAVDEIVQEDEIVNILLVGQDRRPGQGRQRSDSMILCTVNKDKKTLMMTSFLRDLYVTIPGYYDNRLNAAYAVGGFPLLNDTLNYNFGVKVAHNVEVDFSGFEKIINLIGGVDINLRANEAKYLTGACKREFHEGMNHLSGIEALTYARIRHLDSDFGRTNRQRTVLLNVIEKCRNLSLRQMNSLVNSVVPMITTDMSNTDILGYVAELFPILSELQISTQYIPAENTYQSVMIRGMAVLLPDLEKNHEILENTLH